MPYPIWPRDRRCLAAEAVGSAVAGSGTAQVSKRPTTPVTPTPTKPSKLAPEAKREKLSHVLDLVDQYLSRVGASLLDLVDPHDEQALVRLFVKMTSDPVIRYHTSTYVAGTGFAKTLKALAHFSMAATNDCSVEMATDIPVAARIR